MDSPEAGEVKGVVALAIALSFVFAFPSAGEPIVVAGVTDGAGTPEVAGLDPSDCGLVADVKPEVINLRSRGVLTVFATPQGGCRADDFLLDAASLEGGAPLERVRVQPDGRVVFQVHREEFSRYFLAMDPARWVGGYNLRLTVPLADGTSVRAVLSCAFEDRSPMVLALDRDFAAPGEFLHAIGRNLNGGAVRAWFTDRTTGEAVEGEIAAGPVNGDYPGLGKVQVVRIVVPPKAVTGAFGLEVGGERTNNRSFSSAPGAGGGPPRIFLVLPSSGPAFMPLGIGGTNFDAGAIPYVNGVPSVLLSNISTQSLPLIGSVSLAFTIVPPAAPPGPGDVVVEYLAQRSNPFPFTAQ